MTMDMATATDIDMAMARQTIVNFYSERTRKAFPWTRRVFDPSYHTSPTIEMLEILLCLELASVDRPRWISRPETY